MGVIARDRPSPRRLRRMILVTTLLLVAQLLLGMAVNLFVMIPTDHPGANPAEYFSGVVDSVRWAVLHGWVWLALHAILGLVLALGSIGVLVASALSRRWAYTVVGVFGFIGVVGAGFNGASFLNYGENVNSYIMTVGLAIALIAYATGLFLPVDAGTPIAPEAPLGEGMAGGQ